MKSFSTTTRCWITAAIMTALLGVLAPDIALAGGSVRGHGTLDNGPSLSDTQISVDAWLDDQNSARGMIQWTGDDFLFTHQPGGPALPYNFEILFINISGNSAEVLGIVTNCPNKLRINQVVNFTFTDNSGTGQPDQINGVDILAGKITVTD